MAVVHLTINDRKVVAPAGSTVLKAAQGAGIDIPTLCNHPALSATGACRICVVEVEGQRALQTSCTFPVIEGMVIRTESPRVVAARKLVLDMLFSERNHFCMYCEASGACELQALGYRYGIDHWVYPTYRQPYLVDASHPQLLMEQNRCILCGRCVRACGDLVANHTLGLRGRGTETRVHPDSSLPWGASSCISCGTCMQVCPTGALSEKRSAYMGQGVLTETVQSTCSRCSIGCGISVVTRGGRIVCIKGDWEAAVNGGLLCRVGRFDPLTEKRARITTPLIRRKNHLESVTWETAIQTLAKRIEAATPDELGALATSHATNEALFLLETILRKKGRATRIGLLEKTVSLPFKEQTGCLEDLARADLILLVGADPVNDQPVSSFLIKRAVDQGIRLLVVGDRNNALAAVAYQVLAPKDLPQAVGMAERAEYPVVVYGAQLDAPSLAALKPLHGKGVFIPLQPGVNTAAAEALGFKSDLDQSGLRFLFILQGEAPWTEDHRLKGVGGKTFTVVQTCFDSPLIERADMVLPAATWWETSGSLTNTEGALRPLHKVVEPLGEAKTDWEILTMLGHQLGYKLETTPEALWASAGKAIAERRTRHGKG